MTSTVLLFIITLFLLSNAAYAAKPADAEYRPVGQIALEGADRWDYLTIDPTAHRLYITRATHVMVFDTYSNNVVGDIPNMQGVHGVALAPDFGQAFISNGKDNAVSVVDLATLKEIARVAVGNNPDAILYEPVTKQVFAFNGKDGTASVIDAASNKVTKTVTIGGKLEFAVSDSSGTVYDNVEDKNEIAVINPHSLAVIDRWQVNGCKALTALAIDAQSHRLFAACDNNTMAVINTDTGNVIALLPIGSGPDAVVFDKAARMVVTSNGESGTLSFIHEESPDRYANTKTVITMRGARTLAIDAQTRKIYSVTAKFGATPLATIENPHPRPSIVPGSVVLLIYEPETGTSPR